MYMLKVHVKVHVNYVQMCVYVLHTSYVELHIELQICLIYVACTVYWYT